MSAIANWQFSMDGLGTVQIFSSEFYYAGGVAVIGFGGGGGNGFEIFNLGNSEIALMISLTDQDNNVHDFYWNSHYGTSDDGNNNGMTVWDDQDNYQSNSIGSEQTFKLINLGSGNVALQATGGAFPGQYLGGMSGGWYPDQWSLGSGSFLAVGNQAALQVQGDQLPILLITNSGYKLDLSGRDLGSISLENAGMQSCNLGGANLSAITSIQGADFTGASMRGANLSGQNLAPATTWSTADFTNTDLTAIATAAGAVMPGAIFDGGNLTERSFAGAHLNGASFVGTTLDGVDFTGADLTGANLAGASLKGTIFNGATLQGTHFDKADLSTAQFDSDPNFTRTTTNRTTFIGATVPFTVLASNWSYLDLTEATITGIPSAIANLVADGALLPDGLSLQGIDLTDASFVGTQMYEIQLQNANLQGANLSNALLKGAYLNSANLTLANLDSAYLIAEQSAGSVRDLADLDQLSAAVVTDAFMFNTILDGAHCDGVDFSGVMFVTASNLSSQSASAIGATMNFAKFNNASVVLAVFNGAQLSAANFAQAVMVGAEFLDNGSTATELTPSSDVTHTPASVYQADIRGTNFTGANMDGLDMRGATFSTSSGEFEQIYIGYNGAKVPVAFDFGPTILGNTTSGTTCPDGNNGPCTLAAVASATA